MSDIKQGVTLEIFGEGNSMGPVNDRVREEMIKTQGDIRYDVTWKTLGEYLDFLVKKGVSPNVASFVGATTVRENVVGYDDGAPTPAELEQMQELVRQAMREGALGVGSSLIYAPASYAKTDELIALSQGGRRVRRRLHLPHAQRRRSLSRSAGRADPDRARSQGARAGLSPEGRRQEELAEDAAGDREDRSRAQGGPADHRGHVCYTAGATGLDAAMPTWVQEGGIDGWVARLKKPDVRKKSSPKCAIPTRSGRACCSRPARPIACC